jgi:hypothetical protein
MRFRVQLIVESDDHRPIVTELARVERSVLGAKASMNSFIALCSAS